MGAVAANAEIAGRAEYVAAEPFERTIDDDAGEIAPRRAREYRIRASGRSPP